MMHGRKHIGGPRDRAFTLLEMLTALALMGVLVGSLYGGLHIAFNARSAAVATLGPVRAAQLAIDLLREDFESAIPPGGILAGSLVGEDATGDQGRDADAVTLYSLARGSNVPEIGSEIRRVEVAVDTEEDPSSPRLVRRITTNLMATEVPEPVEEVLCTGVRAFNLRYYDGTEWLDTWDAGTMGNVLPLAVEVTLEVERPARRGEAPGSYRVARVLQPLCARLPDDGSAAQSSTSSSSQGGP